jgi:transcriptional regulator with XRE-family HTH domain
MSDTANRFGEYIRQKRLAKHWSQGDLIQQLAKTRVKVGKASFSARIDATYLSKIENGKIDAPPSESVIRGLAKALSCDEEELLTLAGQFDARELQRVASTSPEVAMLLRRLQRRELSDEQIRKLLGGASGDD